MEKPQFFALLEAMEPIDVTPEAIHHAAAGLALLLWRNTDAVETDAHHSGPWTDADMIRKTTRATEILREALSGLTEHEVDGDEALLDAMREISDLLPTEAMKDALWEESHRKADFWGTTISEFGAERALAVFVNGPAGLLGCPDDWWGHPDYPARVEMLSAMDPPDPATFKERALRRPWDLSDEQAWFIANHRYDRVSLES